MGSYDHQPDYYRFKTSEASKEAFGNVAGAEGTTVAQITNPGPGTWKIYGHGYADVANGLKIVVGGVEVADLAAPGNTLLNFGPVYRLVNDTDDIAIQTAATTTASAATVYAKRIGS